MTLNTLRELIFRSKDSKNRDSKGRFISGNKYRFKKTNVVVEGAKITVLMQNPQVGNFFRATKKKVK